MTLSGEILLIQIHPVSHACAYLAQTEVVRGPLATVRITFQPLQVELLILPPLLLAQRKPFLVRRCKDKFFGKNGSYLLKE